MSSIYPLISVVMTTCDRQEYLPEAIASVLMQVNYDDFEFVLYDDGNDFDAISDLYDRLQTRLGIPLNSQFITDNKPHKGFAYALNRGIEEAVGEWIVSVDSDDVLALHALETIVGWIQDNPEAQFLYSDYCEIDGSGERLRVCKAPIPTEIARLDLNGVLPFHLTAYRKSLYELVGGTDLKQHKAVDVDLYLKMLEHTVPVHIPDVLYHHRIHPNRMGANPDEQVLYAARAVRNAVQRRGLNLNVRTTWSVTNPDHY